MSNERKEARLIFPGRARGPGGRHGGLHMPMQKAKDFRGTLKRLLGYIRPHRVQLLAVLVFTLLSTAFSILGPRIMGKAITKIYEGIVLKLQRVPGAAIDFAYVRNILLILGMLYGLSALFRYLQHFIMAGVAQSTVYDMRKDINAKFYRLPLKFFDSRAHGDILSRVTNDVDNISSTLQQSVIQLITALVTVVGVTIMMLSMSPSLTLIALFMLPLSAVATLCITRRSQRHFVGQQSALGELSGYVEEVYTGHKIVKAFGREESCIERFNETNDRLYEHAWKAQFISGIIMPLMRLINNVGYVIICVAGGILVTRKAMELGDVQAFINYMRHFTQPIVQTASIVNILQSTVASAERVFEILDEVEEEPDPRDAKVIEAPKGEIKFENVRFSYKRDTTLIDNMNIDVKQGETIAIVGPTGAGKTTLVNLLMRFYEIEDGKITVDGVDIRDLRRGDLRTMFGMVLQDTWLFNGTVRENIAYGREGASHEDVVRAAKAAHADYFIRSLPEGYDTLLKEDASNISQGQMQLITIARAILADPVILILDEATSSVDTYTEIQIQRAMHNLMKGRTSFIIAHRLSTIREADLILVMDNGSIIEHGKHGELLDRGGFYAELYNSQFSGSSRQAV